MPSANGPSKFQQKLEERRRAAEQAAQVTQQARSDDDLVPDADYERSEEDLTIDKVIESIDILDAYDRWVGKNRKAVHAGQKESIKVSCPIPGHKDNDPSAWVNTEKKVWNCAVCGVGGDVYDLAAYYYGFPVPGYKEGATFHELRRRMAESQGYTVVTAPGMTEPAVVPAEPVAPEVPKDDQPVPEPPPLNVIDLYHDEPDDNTVFPSIPWREIVEDNTFLARYLELTTIDDVAEEYHFWNALLAIGFALGRDVTLFDRIPVYGNLFICTLGHTGSGKSQAKYHLDRLLSQALPYKFDDPNCKGVRRINSPGSAEVLIHNFSKPVPDPANPKAVAYYAPVRGIVDFNELASLTGRSSRQGNVLKPTLMQFYDMEGMIATSSMTTGEKQAHQPFCSALTTTQPRALKSLISAADSDSGFLNRWVFACGPEKKRVPIGGIEVDIDPAVQPLMEIAGWAGTGKQLQWSTDALEKFSSYFYKYIEPAKRQDDTGLLVRIDLLFKKLILLFAANQHEDVITAETVDRALSLYDYVINTYGIPAMQIGNTQQAQVRESILYHARRVTVKNGTGISRGELKKLMERKKYPIDLVLKVLKYMCDLGELQVVSTSTSGIGRPTVRYRYVDLD